MVKNSNQILAIKSILEDLVRKASTPTLSNTTAPLAGHYVGRGPNSSRRNKEVLIFHSMREGGGQLPPPPGLGGWKALPCISEQAKLCFSLTPRAQELAAPRQWGLQSEHLSTALLIRYFSDTTGSWRKLEGKRTCQQEGRKETGLGPRLQLTAVWNEQYWITFIPQTGYHLTQRRKTDNNLSHYHHMSQSRDFIT